MSDWKAPYRQGISSFRADNLQDALELFSEAIHLAPEQFTIYDSRAAVYQKLGNPKDALRDAKRVIDLAPGRWQGYARSSRLFLMLSKQSAALQMVQLALERVPADDSKRRAELVALQEQITQDVEKRRHLASQSFYHFGKLPLEIAVAIFTLILEEDHAAVVSLAGICRSWRMAVLDTSAFWGTLVLTNIHPLKKAKLWSERSKGRLVVLSLHHDFCLNSVDPDEVKGLPLGSLRVLKVDTPPHTWADKYLTSLKAEVWRNLHELDLSFTLVVPPALLKQPDIKLRRLTLKQMHPTWATAADHCRHLEHVFYLGPLHARPLHDFLLLLAKNPSLQTLVLRLWPPQPLVLFESTLPPILEFPSLTELEITDHDTYIVQHFSSFALPSLHSLTFSRVTSVNSFLRHLLHGGFTTKLVEFRAQQCALTADTVVAFLRAAMALETLELSHVGGKEATIILEALATPTFPTLPADAAPSTSASPQFLCPALRHINFSHCPDVKGGPLVRLVKTRLVPVVPDGGPAQADTPNVAAIETLIVDACPAVDADILPWLRSKVPVVSCVYMTKKQARWKR